MKITNAHGEKVELTKAQLREYRNVQNSREVFVERSARKFRIYQLLAARMLITVVWSYGNGVSYRPW